MKKLNVGIIGCGTIGSKLAKVIDKELGGKAVIVGICDIDKARALKLRSLLKKKPKILSLSSLIKKSSLVIEAASAKTSGDILKRAISAKKDIMLMSIGGLLNYKKLFKVADKKGIKIYLPSGAISGVDAIKAASHAGIKSVHLTTRKPPKGLEGAPYIIKNKINIKSIKGEKVIFDGNAKKAVKAFPKNVNVSALLSLAGIGAAKTRVTIITSHSFKRNSHQVEVEGNFGKLSTMTENVPSPDNPKTSYLAALSAVATLKQILSSLKIGT